MKDLACVDKEEQKKFLDSFDVVLSDVDGVLWMMNNKYPGSTECINSLKNSGKNVHFVSNNCTMTVDQYLKKFEKLGLPIEKNDLVIPTLAIISYLKKINFDKTLFVIGMSSIKKDLQNAGFKVASQAPNKIDESLAALMAELTDDKEIGGVVVDFDLNVNYVALQKCVSYLKRPEVIFISAATDKRLPIAPNFTMIGPNSFLEPIELISQRKPIPLGKPGIDLNDYIMEKYCIEDPKRVLFIGDSIIEDISFANKCGYQNLLVLTGATKRESLNIYSLRNDCRPDYYIDSLGKLEEVMENLQYVNNNNKL